MGSQICFDMQAQLVNDSFEFDMTTVYVIMNHNVRESATKRICATSQRIPTNSHFHKFLIITKFELHTRTDAIKSKCTFKRDY